MEPCADRPITPYGCGGIFGRPPKAEPAASEVSTLSSAAGAEAEDEVTADEGDTVQVFWWSTRGTRSGTGATTAGIFMLRESEGQPFTFYATICECVPWSRWWFCMGSMVQVYVLVLALNKYRETRRMVAFQLKKKCTIAKGHHVYNFCKCNNRLL